MEPIINFFEQYWGYTLVGGVTIGTIVTTIFLQLRSLGIFRSTNRKVDDVSSQLNVAVTKYEQSEKEKTEIAKQNVFLGEVIGTTFKALSYLTLASKLSPDEKLELQKDFNKLAEDAKRANMVMINDGVKVMRDTTKAVLSTTGPILAEIAAKVVTEGKSILDKYTKDREGV